VTKILHHQLLSLDQFRFCEAHFTIYQQFVANKSAIFPHPWAVWGQRISETCVVLRGTRICMDQSCPRVACVTPGLQPLRLQRAPITKSTTNLHNFTTTFMCTRSIAGVFSSGTSQSLQYCTILVCILNFSGMLAVWWLDKQTNKLAQNCRRFRPSSSLHSITAVPAGFRATL